MNSPFSDSDHTALSRVPRIDSLFHRLRGARNANGQPVPLRDELLAFLDNPPLGMGDRWQAGAELCQRHGVTASRMAVWRFYRAHILAWRRQIPAPSETAQTRLTAFHRVSPGNSS